MFDIYYLYLYLIYLYRLSRLQYIFKFYPIQFDNYYITTLVPIFFFRISDISASKRLEAGIPFRHIVFSVDYYLVKVKQIEKRRQ
ncbi:hypothetical protein ACJX0J_017949, partial [Zea mays]